MDPTLLSFLTHLVTLCAGAITALIASRWEHQKVVVAEIQAIAAQDTAAVSRDALDLARYRDEVALYRGWTEGLITQVGMLRDDVDMLRKELATKTTEHLETMTELMASRDIVATQQVEIVKLKTQVAELQRRLEIAP